MRALLLPFLILMFPFGFWFTDTVLTPSTPNSYTTTQLKIVQNSEGDRIELFRDGEAKPILVQIAKNDFRPYLHPMVAPDGNGFLTEYSPGHHKHQTGIYWGFTRVNGRDYFHHPEGDYWRKVSASVIVDKGEKVKWQTVYNLLDSTGVAVLTETQNWTMSIEDGKYILDLEWNGEAQTDVIIGKYDYGGLFVRMPWKAGIKGEVMNAARQRNEKAEGQRAMWVDAGMQVEGRNDLAHIAIFEHPTNRGYPQYWRVDSQLGIGPATARLADWTIKKGSTETIKYQLYIYTGELDDVKLNEAFGKYSGRNTYITAALWDIARKEGRDAKFLTADEAVAAMTIKDGFKVSAWAAEPMVTQPMAFCWDDRGRLWVAENRDYEDRGKGFSNSGDSRIVILEDTDHDGKADSRKVFMEGIAFPAAIAVGFDGVFVGAPPNLLFIPDKNHDDKADVEDIEVRLTGWGIRDRHETLNSFHWGPDGWLYGTQGFATPSKIRKPQGEGKIYGHGDVFPENILEGEGTDINGGVWRYHPTKEKFEVVAHGFSNPWGIDFNSKGQLFITACVIPHLWYVIPGGIYHRQGGQHFNPYIYDDIKTIADHSHRSAHGGARIYQSDAFPESENGKIFMANIHEHGVLSDVLIPKGSGYVGQHGDDFMMANNAQWVGFSMEIGPEGSLYVLDWHDADICGADVLHKETGRIFRMDPKVSNATHWAGRYDDLNKLSDLELANLQTSKSDWHARRARIILQNHATKQKLSLSAIAALQQQYKNKNAPDYRLRAMWALFITNSFSQKDQLLALTDQDPYIRAWAIQFLCEDKKPNVEAIAVFAKLAKSDPSSVVRLYLASALQRMDDASRLLIAGELAAHAEDATDHNIPKMLWFGIEPLIATKSTNALKLASQSKIPILTQDIARRLVDADATDKLLGIIEKSSANQQDLLEGMRSALDGRYDIPTPSKWKAVYAQLIQKPGAVSVIAKELNQHFGDAETAIKQLIVVSDKSAPIADRTQALRALSLQQRAELVKELPNLLNDANLRKETIRAIAYFDNEALGKQLMDGYGSLNPSEKAEVVQTMASRSRYGWMLTQALAKGTIPKRDVPAYTARQLRRVVGSGFVEVWGPIDHVNFDDKALIKYKSLLTEKSLATADVKKGKLLFASTCGPCHTLYGEGGNIGPDITGSNRANIDYLLSNILDPSGEIQDAYKMVVVTTRDGRTYVGNVVKETERQLTLRIVGQESVVMNKSDIQSREVTASSMMPTGLFTTMSDQEILDLVSYLRTSTAIK